MKSMKDCRSFIPIFYFLTQLISKISQVEAFTRPCNVSQQTVTPVPKCPTNLSSYETAAKNKNCSFLAEEAQGCEPLQYHCVLSEDLKYAIEVCAPSIYIIDHVCAKFSTEHKSIMRVEGLDCSRCPYSYNSTTAFEYLQCYSNLTQPLTTEHAQSKTRTTFGTEKTKDRNSDVNSTSVGKIEIRNPVIAVSAIGLGIILAALIFLFVKKYRNVPNHSGNYERYFSVPVSEYGDVLYHSQPGDDEEHVDISHIAPTQNSTGPEQALLGENQDDIDGDHDNGEARSLLEDIHNQLNEESSQSNEIPFSSNSLLSEAHLPIATITEHVTGSRYMPPQMSENRQNQSNNEGNSFPDGGVISSVSSDQSQLQPIECTWHQASMKTTISAASETDQIMLECAVHFLLRNLENPDESWTKGKIVSHVEKIIQKLINSNAEQLLISFIKRVDSDKKIAATLLKCGERMFELISSIQEKYVANKLKITDGCVCVTFCFADASDLQNYLEKVRKKDKHLITGLSKILLNETLLRIFEINPKVVTWKASELKVYKGSHLVKTETFLEPITGSPKDFTGISEESSEESEDEKKCNMFGSKETSKNPGYRKYRTRAKSFDDCKVDWLKDKKEEFAKYGFLYQGVGCKTNCFHCGCFKDNWTEKDDIFATHFLLRQSCAYVQYLNTLLMKQK